MGERERPAGMLAKQPSRKPQRTRESKQLPIKRRDCNGNRERERHTPSNCSNTYIIDSYSPKFYGREYSAERGRAYTTNGIRASYPPVPRLFAFTQPVMLTPQASRQAHQREREAERKPRACSRHHTASQHGEQAKTPPQQRATRTT